MSLGDHLADAEHREAVPVLNDRYSPNPAAIEDLPTTVVWPQQQQQPQVSASWRQWLRWPPPFLQNPPAWLQIRWYWVVIAAIIALGAAGLLASELLHENPGTIRAPKAGSGSPPGALSAPAVPVAPPPLPSNAKDLPSTGQTGAPGSAAGSAPASAAPGATPPAPASGAPGS
jgi:hypothetical protein